MTMVNGIYVRRRAFVSLSVDIATSLEQELEHCLMAVV
jgi:hypothetical protein